MMDGKKSDYSKTNEFKEAQNDDSSHVVVWLVELWCKVSHFYELFFVFF